jgi:hypothetical protein
MVLALMPVSPKSRWSVSLPSTLVCGLEYASWRLLPYVPIEFASILWLCRAPLAAAAVVMNGRHVIIHPPHLNTNNSAISPAHRENTSSPCWRAWYTVSHTYIHKTHERGLCLRFPRVSERVCVSEREPFRRMIVPHSIPRWVTCSWIFIHMCAPREMSNPPQQAPWRVTSREFMAATSLLLQTPQLAHEVANLYYETAMQFANDGLCGPAVESVAQALESGYALTRTPRMLSKCLVEHGYEWLVEHLQAVQATSKLVSVSTLSRATAELIEDLRVFGATLRVPDQQAALLRDHPCQCVWRRSPTLAVSLRVRLLRASSSMYALDRLLEFLLHQGVPAEIVENVERSEHLYVLTPAAVWLDITPRYFVLWNVSSATVQVDPRLLRAALGVWDAASSRVSQWSEAAFYMPIPPHMRELTAACRNYATRAYFEHEQPMSGSLNSWTTQTAERITIRSSKEHQGTFDEDELAQNASWVHHIRSAQVSDKLCNMLSKS